MKNEKGITLVSLIIYVVVMTIVILIMNSIITTFYSNTEGIDSRIKELNEFNKFNNYFLKEVKLSGNSVDRIYESNGQSYILFASGNSISFIDNVIYYNNIEICDNINNLVIKQGKDGDGLEKNIINVTVEFNNFSKTMNYKLETIY